MKRGSITRLRRIMHLTDLMYEIEVRAIAELKQEQADLDAEIEATRAFLGADGIVADLFPSLIARRIGRLRHDHQVLDSALKKRVEGAIGARAGSIGIANRVEQELQRRRRSLAAASLDEIADRVARERTASLRQGPPDRLVKSDRILEGRGGDARAISAEVDTGSASEECYKQRTGAVSRDPDRVETALGSEDREPSRGDDEGDDAAASHDSSRKRCVVAAH